MERDVKEIKKDRLLYTKNKISANLTYLGIVFGVFYFVSIYQSDVNNYYYTFTIGISVIYNLMFLLIAFLSSEGLKNYKISYAFMIIVVGIMQIVRIWGIPMDAHNTLAIVKGEETLVMDDSQFQYCCIALIVSAVCCILAGLIGIYKTVMLNNYKREKGLE